MSSLLFWGSLLIMILGVAGTVAPILPGTPLIFLTALGYGYLEGFTQVSPWVLGILFLLMAVTFVVDYLASMVGAKKFGASKHGTWGTLLGGILGILVLGIPGLLIGPIAGAIAGEMIAGSSVETAVKVGFGTVVGLAGGAFFKVVLAGAMVIIFVTAVI